MDITGYNINISNATSNLIMMTVNVTEYTYNVSEFGSYTVSVVATIGELEGVIDTTVINVPEVYNTPKYSTVYTTVSLVLIESTIIITSSTAMCCSYTTTINKSPEVSTSIHNTTNSTGVPSEGGVVAIGLKFNCRLCSALYTVITENVTLIVVLSQFVNH